jgi:thiol:disulfide interchange protein DsbD
LSAHAFIAAAIPLASLLRDFESWVGGISERLASAVSGASDPLAIAIFFAAGVLASLTPCVYPMIPIVVAYMGGAESAAAAGGGGDVGRRQRVVFRSLAYVVGMALVYTALGLTAVLLGRTFGAMTQTAWAYWIVGGVLVVFALSLVGLFELRVPNFILQRVGTGPREGMLGAVVMGATSAVVAAPCAAPIVFPLVTIIGTQQRVVFGTVAMLAFSLGLGLLFLLLGISSGLAASVPRPGAWMVRLKAGLGVVMILLSLYFFYQGYLKL